ncbi:MAG: hypothetical protein A2146_09380 [Actinobacteria bacterium RBG_16_67_10]|nr:MAG: hypothetical protein A2146_09380 [Actinobacteria bacterium RBG_16_67_10]
MLTNAIRAALVRRDPYVRMVVAVDGVADGAIIVAVTNLVLVVLYLGGDFEAFVIVRVILDGLIGWIVLSGMVYLVGRRLLDGYGSFPSTMAATSIGYPVVLSALVLRFVVDPYWAVQLSSLWLVVTVWMAARVALELDARKAAIAAVLGWVAYLIVRTVFRV